MPAGRLGHFHRTEPLVQRQVLAVLPVAADLTNQRPVFVAACLTCAVLSHLILLVVSGVALEKSQNMNSGAQ